MAATSPTLEEWRKLYQRAESVKELAPWEWMDEMDLFAVQDPKTGTPGFVSIMGQMGEHFAVSVYLGPEGLRGFWDLQETDALLSTEQLLQIPQLQASFEDRTLLDRQDLDTIKKLGLKFRGRNAWPMFRSFRPGFLPWHLEAKEVRFLETVLEQVLDVAPRFKEDTSLLTPSEESDDYLVRVPQKKEGHLTWQDRVLHVVLPDPPPILISIERSVLEDLRGFPPTENRFEMDFFMAPIPVQEKGERPFFPYVLMIVDGESGAILSQELLQPVPSLEAMWGKIPGKVADRLLALGGVPGQITVRSEFHFQLMQPLADELDLIIDCAPRLPALDLAKAAFLEFISER
jgi:hypothetical protein